MGETGDATIPVPPDAAVIPTPEGTIPEGNVPAEGTVPTTPPSERPPPSEQAPRQ
jgi:hypothetical protein